MSELCADLVGMVCSYPLVLISTCVRTGSIRTWGSWFVSPWTIIRKNGFTALWWGLVPYMLSRLVVTLVWGGVEQQLDTVEERLFPKYQESDPPSTVNFKRLLFRQLSTLAKATACALAVSPLEVVACYMQASSMADNGRLLLAGWGFWCVRALWHQGGVGRFYRGCFSGIMYNWLRGSA